MRGKFVTTQIWITCISSQRSKETNKLEYIDMLLNAAVEKRTKVKQVVNSEKEPKLVA